MKKLLFAFMAMTLLACSSEDSAPVDPNNGDPNPENPNPENPNPVECTNVFTGNLVLATQAAVNTFGSYNYCKIDGSLTIGKFTNADPGVSDITDISALSSLVSVNSISVAENPNLISLTGLHNIKDASFFSVSNNPALTNLIGCPGLIEGGAARIDCRNLNSLEGLKLKNRMAISLFGDVDLSYFTLYPNVEILSELSLSNNKSTTLEGLENIRKIGYLNISACSDLTSLKGLENLTEIEGVLIADNPELISIEHLSGLTAIKEIPEGIDSFLYYGFTIRNNNKLMSLQGLENLSYYDTDAYAITIKMNPVLSDLCAIDNCLQNNPETELRVYGNSFNPTKEDITSGNCSQ